MILAAILQATGCSTDANRKKPGLQTFKGWPAGLSNCACVYFQDESTRKDHRHILVTDSGAAHISISGKIMKLQRVSGNDGERAVQGNPTIYSNNFYSISIDKENQEQADAAQQVRGKMELFFKDQLVDTASLSGECPCEPL
ncbi:MAG: hypothetical protein EOP49_07535 [Sphingobacteriales bacterium]|nr:MAG: hypothetical protein EOP49_07535 [Sphingobacteriales bacterium]